MVTDTIIVRTVSFRSPDITLEWKGHSDGTYTITELTEKMPVGTEIILRHSNKATEADAADYYHADEISNLITAYITAFILAILQTNALIVRMFVNC